MTQEQILENNKLIAEFMGVKIGVDSYSWRIGCIETLKETHLNYHSEWGWLMPVLEKLENLGYEININGNECYVLQPNIKGKLVTHCKNWTNKLETIYNSVVSTINWHNQINN